MSWPFLIPVAWVLAGRRPVGSVCSLCGVLGEISTGYSALWMNGQFLPLMQYPLRKYLHTALYPDLGLVCSCLLSRLYVSLMIRLKSWLAFCTFCLFPAILNVFLFPFVIVWIFTWCFFSIVFIVVAWCP